MIIKNNITDIYIKNIFKQSITPWNNYILSGRAREIEYIVSRVENENKKDFLLKNTIS